MRFLAALTSAVAVSAAVIPERHDDNHKRASDEVGPLGNGYKLYSKSVEPEGDLNYFKYDKHGEDKVEAPSPNVYKFYEKRGDEAAAKPGTTDGALGNGYQLYSKRSEPAGGAGKDAAGPLGNGYMLYN